MAALRRGRAALTDLEAQLDALLVVVRRPAPPDHAAPARLRGAATEATSALGVLEDMRRLVASRA